ncbi:uncharacterized protein ASPGLDRAFT_1454841 [Aspergillus glaucus CBS 516.65]|uniref:Uncharacterized protein n=1 Tax=Aspergillus glaucus CBS 516.65 TaxID=1160497 RepID=A0A1L9VKZ8_ASPGL|nr:hypothetical protein ASPGLDRAFT_1454841 [Aspergillus glaucus CBS 516.65]OJJ84561.1 hypothetical protein ASPGLDRAFT_1454841 [Aspergillus glaucus CBS 516.65]
MTGKPIIPTLRIPTAPSFPLSSPITEEIPSPPSSTCSDERHHHHHRDNRHQPVEVSKTARLMPLLHTSERDAHRSQMVETDEQGGLKVAGAGTSPDARKPVGLNLVTDFSSSSLSVPKPKKRGPTLVDLEGLKTLCRTRERERSVQMIKGILKKRRSQGLRRVQVPDGSLEPRRAVFDSHSPVTEETHERPNKKRKDELSPGDRPITIGLSVTYADSVDSDSDKGKSREREIEGIDSQITPVTPSIIVTPAGEDSFWEDDIPGQQQHPRPRVASSIYSTPTPNPMIDYDEVPPVPAIPAYHSRAPTATATPNLQQTPNVQQQQQQQQQQRRSIFRTRKSRAYSTGTLFEEDDSPASAQPQPQPEPQPRPRSERRKALSKLSINTDTNRHQSQGWWTYLLSPLLKSSASTSAKTLTPTSPDRPPLLPELRANSTVSSEDWWEKDSTSKEVSCFSPDTPETENGINPVECGWQGVTTTTNPFLNMDRGVYTNTNRGNEGGNDMASGMFAGQVIQGCAAEYYQACAHELFSGRPYFECVGHVCSITPVAPAIQVSEAAKVEEKSGGKGVAGFAVVDKHAEVQSPNSENDRAQYFSGSTAVNAPSVREPETMNTAKPKEGARNLTIETGSRQPDLLNPFTQTTAARPATPVTPFCVPPVAASPPPPLPQTNTATTVTVERAVPHYIVVPQSQPPQAPSPVSPAFQQATERTGIPLSSLQNGPAPSSNAQGGLEPPKAPAALASQVSLWPNPHPTGTAPTNTSNDGYVVQWPNHHPERDVTPPIIQREFTTTQIHEKQDKTAKNSSKPSILAKCLNRKTDKKSKTKRRCYAAIACLFLMILVVAILLAVFLTHKSGPSSPSTDTNTTKTTLATIAGPKSKKQESGCVYPETLWSCALPKEQQENNNPYDADEPNFLVQIRFRNGTYSRSTVPVSKRSGSGNSTWEPSPSVPSTRDQEFLGNTTDNNAEPYAGEETPFFMTFLSTQSSSNSTSDSSLTRRSFFPNLTDIIPPPDSDSDGTAAPANLYPLPESQPIRLYNRDQDDEHYGFYAYFDKSIFLESDAPLNGKPVDTISSDKNGGSTKENARVRCTWSQTRFLVKIWTRGEKSGKTVLQSSTGTTTTTSSTSSPTATGTSSITAEDYTRPGTFPYPVTITLDRHGGSASQKMVYCYGMSDDMSLNSTEIKLQVEERGYDGTLVNAAPGVFNSTSVVSDDGWGGVDGGTGGCGCEWVNWGV